MSFAAGMRAGQEAVSGAIDLYRTAKRNREMREVEEAIQAEQQARAERQFGIAPGQATTGMSAAQQQQAVMPQVSQTGLTPQQLAAGVGNLGVAGAAPAPGTAVGAGTGLGAEQMAAMMQAPTAPAMAPGGEYTPMSELDIERMRAQRLRGLGYTDEADKALGRVSALREEERTLRLDAENKRRWEEDFKYKRGRDKVADEQFDTNAALAQIPL